MTIIFFGKKINVVPQFQIWRIDTPKSRSNFQGVESEITYIAQSLSLPRFWLSRMARISCLFSSRYWNIRHIQLLPASAKQKRTSSRSCAELSDREASCVGACIFNPYSELDRQITVVRSKYVTKYKQHVQLMLELSCRQEARGLTQEKVACSCWNAPHVQRPSWDSRVLRWNAYALSTVMGWNEDSRGAYNSRAMHPCISCVTLRLILTWSSSHNTLRKSSTLQD